MSYTSTMKLPILVIAFCASALLPPAYAESTLRLSDNDADKIMTFARIRRDAMLVEACRLRNQEWSTKVEGTVLNYALTIATADAVGRKDMDAVNLAMAYVKGVFRLSIRAAQDDFARFPRESCRVFTPSMMDAMDKLSRVQVSELK